MMVKLYTQRFLLLVCLYVLYGCTCAHQCSSVSLWVRVCLCIRVRILYVYICVCEGPYLCGDQRVTSGVSCLLPLQAPEIKLSHQAGGEAFLLAETSH